MAKAKHLLSTESWDQIAYPVQLQAFETLLGGYTSVARDRQQFIVGCPPDQPKPVIFGLQGNKYALFENRLIRQVANSVLGQYDLKAAYTQQGEFSLTLSLPTQRFDVLSPTHKGRQPSVTPDTLEKALIITNSYTGKSPFTIQGNVLSTSRSVTINEIAPRMRVSYYRLVCGNGLMGWADEFFTLDEYADWLAQGQPTRLTNVRETKTFFEPAHNETIEHMEQDSETVLPFSRIRHSGFTEESFQRTLTGLMQEFVGAQDSLSRQLYTRLAEHAIRPNRAATYLRKVKIPRKLVQQAIDRMQLETNQLGVKPNLWLLYNGLNHSLFQQPTSLSINQRYDVDGSLFHSLAQAVL
jgi:hypothetical protein